MTKEKMTIHQALSELKLLDNRILRKVNVFVPCKANRKNNMKIGGIDIEEYKKNISNDYKSITDLINRRAAMKKAVVLSNAKTYIDIDGHKYTVAEAIEMKNHGMELWNILLKKIENTYMNEEVTCDTENMGLSDKAIDYVGNTFNGGDKKITDTNLQKKIDEFIDNNTYSIVTGIDCRKEINKLTETITNFSSKVDSQLSISNALTEIEFEY